MLSLVIKQEIIATFVSRSEATLLLNDLKTLQLDNSHVNACGVSESMYVVWQLTSLQQRVEQGGVGKEEEVAKGLGGEGRRQTRLPRQRQGAAVNFHQACNFWG